MNQDMEDYNNLTSLTKPDLLEKALEMKGIMIQKQSEIDLSQHVIKILSKLESVTEELLTLKLDISTVKKENSRLKKRVSELESYADDSDEQLFNIEKRINKLEQYTRRENIEICGIAEDVRQGDLDKTVVELLGMMDVHIDTNDIEACHKLPDNQKPNNIIVRFGNRKIAIDCFRKKKKLKESDNAEAKKCFISENLSPASKEILNECKTLQQDNIINSVWTYNGNILIKFNNGFGDNTRKNFHLNDLDFLYNNDNDDFYSKD